MRASVELARPGNQGVLSRGGAGVFALAIFVSAFLLFSVQPIIAKYILPWFGGSPGVWTACMMFFQVLLLAGYAYAHFSIRAFRPRTQAIVHILLLIAAVAMLPIIPGDRWKQAAAGDPTWRIVLFLTCGIGVPYFALSATGPLLQAWVGRLSGGVAPYRLYALSNLGSLSALVAYPFLVEPAITRRQQAMYWSWGLAAFACVGAVCSILAMRARFDAADSVDQRAPEATSPSRLIRLLWTALPACASALLLASNNVICREIASVPFLWVLPLGLYLLSFILCFDHPRWYQRAVFIPLAIVAAVVLLWMLYSESRNIPITRQIAVFCFVLFVYCMICHGELARLKPPARSLTAFYLSIAGGGAIGGVFVALVAPLIFAGYWELHLSVFGAFVLLLIATIRERDSFFRRGSGWGIWLWLCGTTPVLGLMLYGHTLGLLGGKAPICRARDFYGVLSIHDDTSAKAPCRVLHNGGVVHGEQLLDRNRRHTPITYYGAHSGLARAFEQLPAGRPRRIGVVGLGTGTICAYVRRNDSIRFYEIAPRVEELARTYFTFLADCPGDVNVIIGDGRLRLEAASNQHFDLLVLDAFSGDAIPLHLLTKEAFQIYLRHLAPDGILAVHASNRHLNLRPPLRRVAEHFGLRSAWLASKFERDGELASDWLLMSRRPLDLGGAPEPESPGGKTIRMWTDEDTSLLPILKQPISAQRPVCGCPSGSPHAAVFETPRCTRCARAGRSGRGRGCRP